MSIHTVREHIIYEHDSGVTAIWHGGAYIDLGHMDENGEHHASDVINVYDYEKGAPRIPFTEDAMQTRVDEALTVCADCGESDVDDDNDYDEPLCETCISDRVEADAEQEEEEQEADAEQCEACEAERGDDPDFCDPCIAEMKAKREGGAHG